jgi:hypothetical protein
VNLALGEASVSRGVPDVATTQGHDLQHAWLCSSCVT